VVGGPRCAWGSRSASLLRRETVPLASSPAKTSKRSVDTSFAFHHRFLGGYVISRGGRLSSQGAAPRLGGNAGCGPTPSRGFLHPRNEYTILLQGGGRITQMSDFCCYLAVTCQYLSAWTSCSLRKGAAYSPKCLERGLPGSSHAGCCIAWSDWARITATNLLPSDRPQASRNADG
jgi:hypothetical protein